MRQRKTPHATPLLWGRCCIAGALMACALWSLSLPRAEAQSSDAAAQRNTPATNQPGVPPPNPDPRARTIPELVCTGERSLTVSNDSLDTTSEEGPLRLRLRGNLLYIGQSANTEKFSGLISRIDRRRWASGNATLVLDEALERGAWIRLEPSSTRITTIFCQAFDSSRR